MHSRREFLKKITASSVVLPMSTAAAVSAMQSYEEPYQGRVLRVAIMGLGSYGSRVAKAMKDCKKAKLVGVISGTPSKITNWQKEYNIPPKNCYNYENFDNIKNNKDIDAVYVITPNALHKDQSIRVAKAGKHVICEKPFTPNELQCSLRSDAKRPDSDRTRLPQVLEALGDINERLLGGILGKPST